MNNSEMKRTMEKRRNKRCCVKILSCTYVSPSSSGKIAK